MFPKGTWPPRSATSSRQVHSASAGPCRYWINADFPIPGAPDKMIALCPPVIISVISVFLPETWPVITSSVLIRKGLGKLRHVTLDDLSNILCAPVTLYSYAVKNQ